MASAKRKRDDEDDESLTPRKLRAQAQPDDESASEPPEAQTPSRRGRVQQLADNGTPRSILKKSGLNHVMNGGTPRSNRKLVFATTPTKSDKDETPNGTPTLVRNADHSARRKSNRRLIDHALTGGDGEEEIVDVEDTLAQQILDDEEPDGAAEAPELPVPETPTKRGRGRPKGSGKVGRPRKQRSPTPPDQDHLPPHEEYFNQNRLGVKTSNNTLPPQSLLNHDDYFQTMQGYTDRHESEMEFLLELHSRAYDQWRFELEEGFNICLYGYGSKRPITDKFTGHLYQHLGAQAPYKGTKKTPKIVVINGYLPGISVKDILTTVASAAIPASYRLPNQLSSLLSSMLNYLTEHPPPHAIPVVINSIDSPHLRKSPAPLFLAQLAAHPSINLVCTADTPNFPLLWDVGLRAQYNLLFHDVTTFAPYTAEIDVVETVNELLGRSGRSVGGKEGAVHVLRSLPENARALYRLMVEEQIALLLVHGDEVADEDDMSARNTPGKQKKKKAAAAAASRREDAVLGVEYRVLYHKAVEAFVCSSEVSFRTLLKEFHDHGMVDSRADAVGTEVLWVPLRREELEGLLGEELGEF
ncbi:ORC2-domain-containing protein [Corynespora cassiicola Philippines]|uniref:Origin recognition complex subunit 2 n=1 Tax=Corynespora cassiicola Philippines TaxID=1448308 RepID=A0A2T2N401_CORCC|nr:ORC2-domain-containing protein [Corynespora cassiicola Philippines]